MPEYINKQQLLEKAKSLQGSIFGAPLIIAEIEKADGIETVRCGECRKRNTDECWCAHWEDDYETGFDENGFCSGGERRNT